MELVDFVSRGEATLRSLRSLRRPQRGSAPRSEHVLGYARKFGCEECALTWGWCGLWQLLQPLGSSLAREPGVERFM